VKGSYGHVNEFSDSIKCQRIEAIKQVCGLLYPLFF
jgi:hypothetical protein